MKALLQTVIALSLISPVSALALDKNDGCAVAATEIAKGIANTSKQFNQKSKIVELELFSATEVRNYSLTVEEGGCLNTFDIQLSNDSASKCVIEKVRATGYCI